MALLISSTAFGIVSLVAAVILQFKLPGWKFFAGIATVGEDRLGRIETNGLRRAFSLLFYALFAAFLGGATLLAIKAIPSRLLTVILLAIIVIAFNAVTILFRKYDRNERSDVARRVGRLYLAIVNLFFISIITMFYL